MCPSAAAIPSAKKILFVDDNEHLHLLMRRVLQFMGYESIGAFSAKEGIQKGISERPDLILLDIGLPDMDGRETARLLRSNPTTQHIPIVAFTGIVNELNGKSCVEAGFDDYVVKPVTHELLKEKLQNLLDVRKH